MDKADIKSLTGLRGVAAVWVAGYHLLLPAALIHGLPARMVARGYLAVDLFFVLSGFVLALNYGGRFAGPGRLAALPTFLWRRCARIYPLYGLILVGRLAYTAWRYGSFALPRPWIAAPVVHPWVAIPANLLLVQSWGLADSIIGPAWSVSTEWAAYWGFPLLAAVMLHGSRRLTGAAAAVATALLLWASSRTGHFGSLDAWDGRTAGPMLRCLAGFSLGMGLWRVFTWAPAARLAGHPAAAWCVCAGLVSGLAGGADDLALYPLMPALVLCLACGRSSARWTSPVGLLSAVWPVWLGDISYALYLLHIFLLHPLDQARAAMRYILPPSPADGVAAVLIFTFLLAASALSHAWIERPARAWATRMPLPRQPGTPRPTRAPRFDHP